MRKIICSTFAILLLLAPAAWSAPAAEKPRELVAVMQPFVEDHAMAGAVMLVANGDKVLALKTVGYDDLATHHPMQSDDLFWIASMSKAMTASALMMLVDEGKVNVDDPVEKYLPEFKDEWVIDQMKGDRLTLKRPSHHILVREVLSHTSGLPFLSRVISHIDQYPLSEAVLTYSMSPLTFDPSSKYRYANAGIDTAGRIVEVVSGMPYEQFMQQRLFDPLGMKDTTFFPTEAQLKRLAKSYRIDAKDNSLVETPISQLTYPLTRHDRYPSPAGGLFSTASDVGAFCQMILDGGVYHGKRILSDAAVKQMTSTQTGKLLDPKEEEHGYGFAWGTFKKLDKSTPDAAPGPIARCGHGGAYSTDMTLDPADRLVMVFMVQHSGGTSPQWKKVLPAFHDAAEAEFSH